MPDPLWLPEAALVVYIGLPTIAIAVCLVIIYMAWRLTQDVRE